MTEAEWLTATEPTLMLDVLMEKASDRKLRLFACQACYQLKWRIKAPAREALLVAELFADGLASQDNLYAARSILGHKLGLRRFNQGSDRPDKFLLLPFIALELRVADNLRLSGLPTLSSPDGCILLREIFGNPFRPITINHSWCTATVIALATGIYEEKAFDRMPILADALQDAGCENEDILNHCRQPGEHVKGCWVIDLLLSKQ